MQFIKIRNVKDPIRDVGENAGIDFYIPENDMHFRDALAMKNPKLTTTLSDNLLTIEGFKSTNSSYITYDDGKIYIAPHGDILIPSGIKSKFDPNIALIANNKSGVATKKKLIFGASVIDSSYHGEWHLHIINTSDEYQCIDCGTKIIQFIPHLISMDPVEVVNMTEEEFYKDTTSKRGEGGFGSTGIN